MRPAFVRFDVLHVEYGVETQGPIEMRKQGAAARWLPTEGISQKPWIDCDDQQRTFFAKMLRGCLANLSAGREMNEPIIEIDGRAIEPTSLFGLQPGRT